MLYICHMSVVGNTVRSGWSIASSLLAWCLRMLLAFEMIFQAFSVFGLGMRAGAIELTPTLGVDPFLLSGLYGVVGVLLLWSRTTTFAAVVLIPFVIMLMSLRDAGSELTLLVGLLNAAAVTFLLLHDRRRLSALFSLELGHRHRQRSRIAGS